MPRPLDSKFVENFIKNEGYVLLSKFIRSKDKLKLKCAGKNETNEIHDCEISFHKFQMGRRCAKCKIYRIKETTFKKYGYENSFQVPEIREKIKQTNLKKYGYENVINCPEIREKIKETTKKKYGVEHNSQNQEIKEKKKKTNLKNGGFEYPMQRPLSKQKAKETFIKKFGVDHPSKNEEIKEKIKQTTFKNWGVSCNLQAPEIKEKIKQTNLEKFGCEYVLQCPEIKEKSKQTNLLKYGTEHPMQNAEICLKQHKSAYKFKKYTFSSGRECDFQGYENFCLDELLANDIHEDDIVIGTTNVPTISYFYNGKNKIYFPDIYIISQNLLIEVKCDYTFKDNIEKNKTKWLAASKYYNLEVRVYNRDGTINNIHYYPLVENV